ncbi:MAG: hypothetical protein L6Q97_15180 [Thermoanaerobaculia bacterium]|nr:hypothetical protein [Thermoanaerobaculia bacterium]
MKTPCFAAFFALFPLLLSAQPSLRADLDWLQSQLPVYQRWLDFEGLGPTLRAHALEADTMVVLYLGFGYADRDSAAAAWAPLKTRYDSLAGMPLEKRLLVRAAAVFDTDLDHVAVKLYDTYDYGAVECFYRGIYVAGGALRVDSNGCRGPKTDYITITPPDLGRARPTLQARGKGKRTGRHAVLGQAKAFLEQRYGAKNCAGRRVQLAFLQDAPNLDALEAEVLNLCDEVIREGQPSLCAVLQTFGYDCNWKKNEKLHILLTYHKLGGAEGFTLDISLEGRYGSGFFETVGRRGYKDMEVDFNEELTTYLRLFKRDLNRYLLDKL